MSCQSYHHVDMIGHDHRGVQAVALPVKVAECVQYQVCQWRFP